MMDKFSVNLFSRYESRVLASEKRILPIALVTGFLGSGKTTLLNHILSNKENLRIMIAVNDYANMNIDGELFRQQKKKGIADGVVALDCGSFVCSSKEFEATIWNLLQDDYADIDYLVIECSGISNAALAIHSLEKKFGKMTRARLDTVICVIDTESLHHTLSKNESVDKILIKQLMCSDIVVLNKLDLVNEDMIKIVENYIHKLIPNIQLCRASFCKVGLPNLLALDEADSQVDVLSHEGVKQKFYVPTADRSKNFRHDNLNKVETDNHQTYNDYLKSCQFQTIEFTGITPFSINKFYNFIMVNFPNGIVRGKGFLWFHENRSARYSLQLTGRGRIHLEMEENGWQTQPQSNLIFVLHQNIEENKFKQQLIDLCVPQKLISSYINPSLSHKEKIMKYLLSNDLFEIIKPKINNNNNNNNNNNSNNNNNNNNNNKLITDGIIYFRITPVVRYKMDIDHLEHHGIILNDVNNLYIKSLNYSGNTFFVYTHVELELSEERKAQHTQHEHHHHHHHSDTVITPQLVIIWSILGDEDNITIKCFEHIFPRLIENAETAVNESMKHVTLCNCGR